jgi:hypothetical protein
VADQGAVLVAQQAEQMERVGGVGGWGWGVMRAGWGVAVRIAKGYAQVQDIQQLIPISSLTCSGGSKRGSRSMAYTCPVRDNDKAAGTRDMVVWLVWNTSANASLFVVACRSTPVT